MKKFSVALLALATILVFSPAAKADSITIWNFSFTGIGGTGTLSGSGQFTVDTNASNVSTITKVTANISDTYLAGYTGSAVNVTPDAPGTFGYFDNGTHTFYSNDNQLFITGQTAALDTGGIAFSYDNGETLYLTSLLVDATGGSGSDERPVLTGSELISLAPEPGSLILLGTGLVGMAGLLRRKYVASR